MDIPSPYMLMVAPVKKPKVIPAVTHVDGTGSNEVRVGGSLTFARSGTASTIKLYVRLLRDSIVMKDFGSVITLNDDGPETWYFDEIDWPSAGDPVYTIQCHGASDDQNFGTISDRNMSTTESRGK